MSDAAPQRFAPAGDVAQLTERRRKLHIGHFAFIRALVQGIDTRASWDRYMRLDGEYSDLRVVKRTIDWIRGEFAAAARRHHKHGVARLVLVDVGKVSDKGSKLPTLEQFADEHGLEDFSEREQIAQYRAHFGAATERESRRGRLVNKQLEALRWLESLVAQPPRAADAPASWFNPDLAAHLERAGFSTIGRLVEHINGTGLMWWRGIRAIGAGKASAILAWLRANQATIGMTIGAHVQVKRSKLFAHELERVVPRGTAIVPLAKLNVPDGLDGKDGAFRAPQRMCLIRASNDYDALLAWIRSREGIAAERKAALQRRRGIDPGQPESDLDWLNYLSHTQRAYLKEAERFMLWAIVQRQKPLSSMAPEDCVAYRDFLADPAPAERWCGPRGRQKWSPLWRPFEGPLSASAQGHALAILKGLYGFLVDQRYLIGNPWNGVAAPAASGARAGHDRAFSRAQWDFIEERIGRLDGNSANARLRFALRLLYATGLRLSEAVSLKADDLIRVSQRADAADGWPIEGLALAVPGRGSMRRTVTLPPHVVSELSQYLASRGLDRDPAAPANLGAFLLGRSSDVAARSPWSPYAKLPVDAKQGIAASTLQAQLKAFFRACAQALRPDDEAGALRLAAASAHWLRHTYGSHSAAAGLPLEMLRQNLGHASIGATARYAADNGR